ncbi:MAG: phosphoribosylglycinamide formyltransferase [Ferruginibacter sp.]
MFQKLQAKWKVNGWKLLLIIITFALGGSLCGYAGRKILNLLPIDQRWLWIVLYVLLITLLWPVCVLIISIPLGQFGFFKKYVQRVGRKMTGRKNISREGGKAGKRIAIFASGAGSNAKQIIEYFEGTNVTIAVIVCNKPEAGVLNIAAANHIPALLIKQERFFKDDAYVAELQSYSIDLIILAGFLWKVPPALIKAFSGKIINIHPALLPKYGGKGMYGHRVHEAVITAGEKESGISIHFVDDLYDHGAVIFQASCPVSETDTAASLAQKIHVLEYRHYPEVIGKLLNPNL